MKKLLLVTLTFIFILSALYPATSYASTTSSQSFSREQQTDGSANSINVATEEQFMQAFANRRISTINLTQDIVLTDGISIERRELTLRGNHAILLAHCGSFPGVSVSFGGHLIIDGPTITNVPNASAAIASSIISVHRPGKLTLISGEIIFNPIEARAIYSAVSLSNNGSGRGYFTMQGGAVYVNAGSLTNAAAGVNAVGVNPNTMFTMVGGVIGVRGTRSDIPAFDASGSAHRGFLTHATSGVHVNGAGGDWLPGEFIMTGGLIAGARRGVVIENAGGRRDDAEIRGSAVFRMEGGAIAGNIIGLDVSSDRINISGGSISGNNINIENVRNIPINITSPTLSNHVMVPDELRVGADVSWESLYEDAALTAFTRHLTNSVIAQAGAVTNIEKLRAIYDFITLQFNHTHPMQTSTIRPAIDGSRRPAREVVPFPDGIRDFVDAPILGAQGMIVGSRSIPSGDDYVRAAWDMLYGLHSAPGNYAALFVFMAKSVGFEAMAFSGGFREDNGSSFEHVWPAVRLDNNWYFLDVQRESFTNNTNQARHNFFMQSVRDTRVQERYFLSIYWVAYLDSIEPIEGATIFTSGSTAVTPALQVSATRDISIFLNNINLNLEIPPIIIDGHLLVSLCTIPKVLGATADWNNVTRGITLYRNSVTIRLIAGNTRMMINGSPASLDTPPTIVNGTTFVSLRAITEAFGATVRWDGDNQVVYIQQ